MEQDGDKTDMEPNLKWLEIEEIYTRVYLKGDQAEEFLFRDGEVEATKVYLRHRPYNLVIGRPLYPEKVGGICFFIWLSADPGRTDIRREEFVALEDDDRLFFARQEQGIEILENAGWRRTAEIMQLIREAHIIPIREFTDETL